MKRKKFPAAFLALLLFCVSFAMPACAEGFAYSWEAEAGGPHCESLFMVNLDTEEVAYSMNADQQRPMASLTKIMTYIVAYENIPNIETTKITVPATILADLEGTYSSTAELEGGEELTGIQLLNLLMIPSANDAALTLAEYVDSLNPGKAPAGSGKTEGDAADDSDMYFVELMNQKAAELGCANTHFMNPHGLHHESHYTTAREMYLITRYAMSLPNFTEICGTLAYDLAGTNKVSTIRTYYNTNEMFSTYSSGGEYYYTYATGIKTGSHNEAGYCLVASATADGYSYVVVAMGSPYVDEDGNDTNFHGEMIDARELFRWGLVNLKKKTVALQGDSMGEVKLVSAWNKEKLGLVAGADASALLPKEVDVSSIIVTLDIPESVEAPVTKGEEVGVAVLSYADSEIGRVPLVAAESVEKSDVMHFVARGSSFFLTPVFWIIFGIVVLLLIVYFILRRIYRRKQSQLRRSRKFRD